MPTTHRSAITAKGDGRMSGETMPDVENRCQAPRKAASTPISNNERGVVADHDTSCRQTVWAGSAAVS